MALNLFRIKEFAAEKNFEAAELHLSHDGHHFLFAFKIQGKYYAQIEDKVFGGFDGIEDVVFLRGGKIFAFRFSNFAMMLKLIKEENQDYINFNGKIFGPFNRIKDFHFNDNITYCIWYEYFGKSYVVVNNKKFGDYKAVYKVFLSPEGSSFAFQYKDGSKQFVQIDEEIFGGFEDIKDFQMDYPHKFSGFIYKTESGEYFTRINGVVTGPYQSCSDLQYYNEFGIYHFSFQKDGMNSIRVNDFIFEGYDSYTIPFVNKKIVILSSIKEKQTIYHIIVNEFGAFNNISEYALSSDKEDYIFSYRKQGLFYVVTSEYEFGPYESVSNLEMSKNGKNYCFIFQKQYDNFYVNISGEIFGPYIHVSEVKVGNSALNFGFIFVKNTKYFVNISNNLHGMYETASNLLLSDNGTGYSYKFTKRHKSGPLFAKLQDYLSLNGEIIEKNIVVTDYLVNSESIEAIIFKQKEGFFINLNDTQFGPYSMISDCKFLADELLFTFRFKETQNDIEHLQINGRKFYSKDKTNLVYQPIFSSDKKQYAFIHYGQDGQYIQISDQTFGPYKNSFFPSFSPDSKIFIFKYEKELGIYLNINGMDLGPFGKAEYAFSDGKLFICYHQDKMIYIDEITW